jgi:hypothetical protein
VFTNFEIQTRAFWFFKNFWDASVTLNVQPQWTHDYFEMRTAGVMIKRTGYWYASIAGSSDSRKQFFFRYNAGFAESPIYDDAYISLNISPRYRFNDHFSLDIDVKRDEDNGQYGYAFRNAAGLPIAGRRKVTTLTSIVNGIYNFERILSNMRARDYDVWGQWLVRHINLHLVGTPIEFKITLLDEIIKFITHTLPSCKCEMDYVKKLEKELSKDEPTIQFYDKIKYRGTSVIGLNFSANKYQNRLYSRTKINEIGNKITKFLQDEGVSLERPEDFFAEMYKNDK